MRKKLDLPNAIFTGLQVITTPAIALWWAAKHGFHIFHHRVIKRFAPNKRLYLFKKAVAKRKIACHGSRANKGGAFPCAGNRFIIADRGCQIDAYRGCARVGSKAQINTPANAVTCGAAEKADQITRHGDKKGLNSTVIVKRGVMRVMKHDQINIG